MIKTLIIANVAEAFGESIIQIKNKKEKFLRLAIEQSLSQRSIFWEGDNKLIVTPYPIPKLLFQRNLLLSGYKNIINISPSNSEINLCTSIIQDKPLYNLLSNIIKKNPGIDLSPYSATKEFLELIEKLKKEGLSFTTNMMPKDGLMVVSYLDSKAGFRSEILKLQQQFSEIRIPQGFICSNRRETTKALRWFYNHNTSCILKANLGESGWGLLVVKRPTFKSFSQLKNRVESVIKKESIWQKDLIIVEELILGTTSPSVEVFISDIGPKITYVCQQIVNDQGVFSGIILGKKVLKNTLFKKLFNISLIIGKRYWEMGYRGYFDIDFVVSDKGIPFAVETNTRRTGGTHVYDFAFNTFGEDWLKKVVILSKDDLVYGDQIIDEQEVFKRTAEVLYTEKRRKGIVISFISQFTPLLGYFVVGSNLREINDLKNRFENLIRL